MLSPASRKALVLTKRAVERVRDICKSRPEVVGLRIGVKQRGCSGLTYTLDYATEKKQHDLEIVDDGARIFLDMRAQLSLIGSEMDFKGDKLSSQFVFNNPNITGTCGCGESFTIKK